MIPPAVWFGRGEHRTMRELSQSERGESKARRLASRRFPRMLIAAALLWAAMAPTARSQVVRGTVSSTIAGGRVAGAVVLLLDSSLTAHARALTSDSGTFSIGTGAAGRFHLKVMRLGFQPTVSPAFDLHGDTTVAIALTDIPFVLPAVAIRDRQNCRVHPDTTAAGAATFALWDQARTALLAAAITLDERDYRFTKLLHVRLYDTKRHELRDIALQNAESEGTAPWVSLPAEQLRRNGYVTEDDSGMTFFAPDLDVLLSPYFAEAHCFRLTSLAPPEPGEIGLDFEPAARLRHVEIRGTLWLDSASSELRTLRFTFVNLPIALSPLDTILGGHVDFIRLATGAWILPSWSIRMPTPTRTRRLYSSFTGLPVGGGRAHWQLTADWIRVSGGDLRAVRRNDSSAAVLWRHPTGTVRIFATMADSPGTPAPGAIVRLAGSPYAGHADIGGHVRFEQVLPGAYLFEVTTPLHDAIEAPPARVAVTAHANQVVEATVALEPLARAAAGVCDVRSLDEHTAVLAGSVSLGDGTPALEARVTVEWTGGDEHADTRQDGWFRICGIPTGKLLLIKASQGQSLATTALTIDPGVVVRQLSLHMSP